MVVPIPVPSLCNWLSSRQGMRGKMLEREVFQRTQQPCGETGCSCLPLVGSRIPIPFCLCWQRVPHVLASTHLALQGRWLFVSHYSFPGASLKEPFLFVPLCLAVHTQWCPACATLTQAHRIAGLLTTQWANSGQDQMFLRKMHEYHYR